MWNANHTNGIPRLISLGIPIEMLKKYHRSTGNGVCVECMEKNHKMTVVCTLFRVRLVDGSGAIKILSWGEVPQKINFIFF